jgi:hypothetical protein
MSDVSLQQFTLPSFGSGKSPGQSVNPYLAALIDPAVYQVRVPDEYSNQTALYSSRMFFDVYGNTAVGTLPQDQGKFSFFIRPVIGQLVPVNYSSPVSYFRPDVAWPTAPLLNFAAAADYTVSSDPNINFLIGTTQVNGLVREIRPVAMSAWFQFTAPTLTLGGHVACALTDGNTQNYYVSGVINPMAGIPLQEYRNLATLPNSYNGKITEGCYAFYKPFDADDLNFKNALNPYDTAIDYGNQHTYPSIVISGQVISTSGAYNGIIGRIQVDTVFEYVTFSRLVESIPSPVNVPLLWNARQALMNVRTCMANDEHESFIHKVLGYARQLFIKSAPALGSVLGSLVGGPAGLAAGSQLGQAAAQLASMPRKQKNLPPPSSKRVVQKTRTKTKQKLLKNK